jgi:hypothetical protein
MDKKGTNEINSEIFAVLKVDEFAFFSISGRQNSTLAAEI